MAPPRRIPCSTSEQSARKDAAFRKFCSAIVEPGKQGRFKSLLNRDNRKGVCQLNSPSMGLDLLQIAVLLDDEATGVFQPLSFCAAHLLRFCIQSMLVIFLLASARHQARMVNFPPQPALLRIQ